MKSEEEILSMAPPTACDVLVDRLADLGVRHVFGVVGDALNSFNDALRRDGRIKWIGVRHEEAGAFAAGAQAQLGAPLGVCAGTVGPGAIHLLNGLYDAKTSFSPLLAITGQVPTSELGTSFHQEVDLHRLFADVAAYHQTVSRPEYLPRLADIAIRTAIAEGGVAALSLPGDVGGESVGDVPLPDAAPVQRPANVPSNPELERLASLCSEASKVTLLVGSGAQGARAEIERLARTLQAPVAASLRGKEVAECLSEHYVGQTGLIGNPAAHGAIQGADLLVMLGTDLPYRDWLPQSGVKVVQLDVRPAHLGRRCPLELGLAGHVAPTLRALLGRLEGRDDDAFLRDAVERYRSWAESQRAVGEREEGLPRRAVQALTNPSGRLRPEEVAFAIGDRAAEDAIFVADVGMSTVWAARCLRLGPEQRLLTSFNLGSMANALPQAIGAQLLHPDRQVITFSGDGGFSMLMGELATAVEHELPIKIVIFDNASYGMVRLEQQVAGMPPTETGLKNPDFAKVAEAMGALGLRAETSAELADAVPRFMAHDGPAVLDALTNPDALSMPPEFTVDQAWGFATSKLKSALVAARRVTGDDS